MVIIAIATATTTTTVIMVVTAGTAVVVVGLVRGAAGRGVWRVMMAPFLQGDGFLSFRSTCHFR